MPGENLIVFRDSAVDVPGEELARALLAAVERGIRGEQSAILEALLVAGEVECGWFDADVPSKADAAFLTDELARSLVAARELPGHLQTLTTKVAAAAPARVRRSIPEGFAYYALHPEDFAHAVNAVKEAPSAAIVGIRSIGTTLSAIAQAAFQHRGIPSSRTTVRPGGHPYDRRTNFTGEQKNWIAAQKERRALFIVVDEGPGLSGSSFLSVAEALGASGVLSSRILLLGTHDVDPTQLCAPHAAERWRQVGWKAVSSQIAARFADYIPFSGDRWRGLLFESEHNWPPSWAEMEALKYLSRGDASLYKFEGLGRVGREARERAGILAHEGFCGSPVDAGDGMTRYEFVRGRVLTAVDLSRDVLDRLANYIAIRTAEFQTTLATSDQIFQMLRHNFHQLTGICLEVPPEVFQLQRPVLVDGRMQPHKWIQPNNGTLMKVDASRHGDDHFLPGPTSIEWDIAGAIVEWKMSAEAQEYLLARLRKNSGTSVSSCLPWYILAYSTFRAAYSRMAQSGTHDSREKIRWSHAYAFYRAQMQSAADRCNAVVP